MKLIVALLVCLFAISAVVMANEFQTKITCDLLGSTPLCAAHCLALGYSGGYCNGQSVCTCR